MADHLEFAIMVQTAKKASVQTTCALSGEDSESVLQHGYKKNENINIDEQTHPGLHNIN